jgi:hypothetical protein
MMTTNENAPFPARNDAPNSKGNKSKHKINSNRESISMSDNTPTQTNFQHNSRRELLDATKLSRLPERAPLCLSDFDNTPTGIPVVVSAVCAGCDSRLDADDNFQQSIHGCRKCIGIYTRIDAAIEDSAQRKKKELFEKFAGGAK